MLAALLGWGRGHSLARSKYRARLWL
jgi:hypothetical protein